MLLRKSLVKKRLLLFKNFLSKTQNGKKESRRSPPRFWVTPHRNLKWWNVFMNENMIPGEWKENFRISECSLGIFSEELRSYTPKQTTRFRKSVSAEKQVASLFYYLNYPSYPSYFKVFSYQIYTSTYYWRRCKQLGERFLRTARLASTP